MSPIISVKNLQKHFKVPRHQRGALGAIKNLFNHDYNLIKAVNDISFEVQYGELIGYIGPNGAGKSTTLKMLTGLLVPSSGTIEVNGFNPSKQRKQYVANIGAVFGQRTTLWWDLPVIESLALLEHIYKIPQPQFKTNLAEFTELLELTPFLDTPVRTLSLGQRMRADIAAALMHNPEIVFLDEPTIGLDVIAKERIRQFITHINQDRQTTVILTTHDLSDVEKLCNRVLIIDEGSLLYDGDLTTLKNRFGGHRHLIVDFSEEYPNPQIESAEIIHTAHHQVTYQFNRTTTTASALIQKLSSQYSVRDISVREPDIEETVRNIYEKQLLKQPDHTDTR